MVVGEVQRVAEVFLYFYLIVLEFIDFEDVGSGGVFGVGEVYVGEVHHVEAYQESGVVAQGFGLFY